MLTNYKPDAPLFQDTDADLSVPGLLVRDVILQRKDWLAHSLAKYSFSDLKRIEIAGKLMAATGAMIANRVQDERMAREAIRRPVL